MKIKQNLFLKILVFLLALVFFAAAAAMTIYQVANFSVLWEDEEPLYGYICSEMYRRDLYDIDELVCLSTLDSLGTYSQWQLENLKEALDAEHTNLRWRVRNGDSILYGNAESIPERVAFYASEIHIQGIGGCELLAWLAPDMPVNDEYKTAVTALNMWKFYRIEALIGTVLCAVLGVLCAVYLCVTCGYKKGVEGIHLNWFHHIPGDLLLVACGFGVALCMVGVVEIFDYYPYGMDFRWSLILATLCITGIALLVISFLVTFAARCKGRMLLRYTVIGWLLGKLWKLCKWLWRVCAAAVAAIPLIWKAVLVSAIYFFYCILLATNLRWVYPIWVALWILVTMVLLLYICWWVLEWKRVRQGASEIIRGNTSYQINSGRMPSDLRNHADELNNLGQAIGAAVEERMRSEHFKAELITNVSHDLKTPLTSIINYVDLLKKEEIENPKAQEYIEVLDRKSQRLKKLTEDLVEASKASTGALNVTSERLDLVQLVDQALAEYDERLTAHNLAVVRTLPAQPVWVMADGRHLWRVVDNLLSNCTKYALENTRVYVDVQRRDGCACLTVKNISRDELNIPAQQLTERFVRGDESRTMEGSGLGLSIAQSLTELQHGSFEVSVDGDLFKASVTLPTAPETELL